VGRTIRTCSLAALAVALLSTAGAAKRTEPSALGVYVRARVADKASDSPAAVANYAVALTMASDVTMVAYRAYRAGVDGGNYPLALRAAQTLDRSDIVPPDALILLYIAAVRDGDWRAASARLDQIEDQDGFGFLSPLFRSWLDLATGKTATNSKPAASAYVAENDILVDIARGAQTVSVTAVKGLWTFDPYRATSLRLAAAASLAARKQSTAALALLIGDDPTIVAARLAITRGKRLSGAVDSPARGAAFVLARMAGDLMNEGSARSAITLARFATFADPASPNARLVAATALGLGKRNAEALSLVDSVGRDPVYADLARSLRIDRLEALGRTEEAFAEALARADKSVNDLTRLGDLEARRGRYGAAAVHYRRAVDAVNADKASAQLWLALGNALDQSGDWEAGRAALERALVLSPNDPRLLNQLGYGLVVRGEQLDRAASLLRKADAANPENAAITDSIGWAAFKAGQIGRAVEVLERARMLDPVEPEIAEHLGDAYWTAGRRVEARYAWTAARESAADDARSRIQDKIDQGLP
jgi:tetratricopeptide (TPR) repeat protein